MMSCAGEGAYAQLAPGFSVWRHRCLSRDRRLSGRPGPPTLAQAVRTVRTKVFVILDGALPPIDRIGADRPPLLGKARETRDEWAGQRGCGGTAAVRASPALPGAVHDVMAVRAHGIIDALTEDVRCWASKGLPGCRRHRPRPLPQPLGDLLRRPAGGQPLPREDPRSSRRPWPPSRPGAPAQAVMLHHPHHQRRSGRPHPPPVLLKLRL